jgi:hypothetical protein
MSTLLDAAIKELTKYGEQHPEEAKNNAPVESSEKTQLVEKNVELWKEESNPNRLTIIEE